MRQFRRAVSFGLALAGLLAFGIGFCSTPAGAAEEYDGLVCSKARDVNNIVGGPVDLHLFNLGTPLPGCEVKKLSLACWKTSVNAGDDPRGSQVSSTGFMCFKVKCPGEAGIGFFPVTTFGTLQLLFDTKRSPMLCVPF